MISNVLQKMNRFDVTLPLDLLAVALPVLAANVLLMGVTVDVPLVQPIVALVLVLFVPGYLALAVLFPRRYLSGDSATGLLAQRWTLQKRGITSGAGAITWRERIALSLGLSLAIVPLLGLVAAQVFGSLSQRSVLMSCNAYVVFTVVVGIYQRNRVPDDERLRVPFRSWLRSVEVFATRGTTVDRLLSVLVICSVLVALGSVGFGIVSPHQGEAFTSTTLLTENGQGELVASGYPTELTRATSDPLVLRVENNERAATTYSVVVELQRLETGEGSARVREEETVLREQRTLAAGETWDYKHTVEPTMTGEDLRLTYLVFRGDPPSDPTMDESYRNLHIWVSVSGTG